MAHPLPPEYRTSNQPFGSLATQGVVASWYGTEVQYLVAAYGNYQPFGHAGADYPTPIGTAVYAISDGTVLWAGWAEDLPWEGSTKSWLLYPNFPGIVTVIQHSWGISLTAHMSEAWLNVGDRVAEGQQIGLTGNTKARGETVGAHVHIEALVDLSYRTGGGLIYGRTNPEQFYGTVNSQGTITKAGGFLVALNDEAQENIYRAIGRLDKAVAEIYARVFGRDVQRWYHPDNPGDVRTAPFPGAVAARSTDVNDVLSTNKLIEANTNKILTALAGQPGIDASVIAGLREQLAADLQDATKNISVTLAVKDEN